MGAPTISLRAKVQRPLIPATHNEKEAHSAMSDLKKDSPPSPAFLQPEQALRGRLCIAGGGTGGHVLAGIAVAQAWVAQMESQAQGYGGGQANESSRGSGVFFVGAVGGMESRLVPKAGFPLHLLKMGPLNRVSRLRQLRSLVLLPLALVKSVLLLLRLKPTVILGVGGYASGAVLLAAWGLKRCGLLSVKIACLEQNAIPGWTNRVLSRKIDEVFSAFPGLEGYFPGKKLHVVGNPIRKTLQPLSPPAPPPAPQVILVLGGSQGSVELNSLILQVLPEMLAWQGRITWIHQTGVADYERVVQGYAAAGWLDKRIEKFIDDMPQAYQAASLVICRAGSSTLFELAAVGRAALLVPLLTAADGHQEKNAEVLQALGAADLWSADDRKPGGGSGRETLAARILGYFKQPERLAALAAKMRQFNRQQSFPDHPPEEEDKVGGEASGDRKDAAQQVARLLGR